MHTHNANDGCLLSAPMNLQIVHSFPTARQPFNASFLIKVLLAIQSQSNLFILTNSQTKKAKVRLISVIQTTETTESRFCFGLKLILGCWLTGF
jgi:hypothetical protein